MKGWLITFLIATILCWGIPINLVGDLSSTDSHYMASKRQQENIQALLRQYTRHLENVGDTTIAGDTIRSGEALPQLYNNHNHLLIWTNRRAVRQLISYLEESWQQGLLPQDYHSRQLQEYYQKSWLKNATDPELLVKMDVLLSDAALKLAYHLRHGRLNPKSLKAQQHYDHWLDSAQLSELYQAVQQQRLGQLIFNLSPSSQLYTQTVEALTFYRNLYFEDKGWAPISYPKNIRLKGGQSHPLIAKVRERLRITHDYQGAPPKYPNYYDRQLLKAVKQFQQRHNLRQDGILGAHTFAKLNLPLEHKIMQLLINLERARSQLRSIENRQIVVNIPTFWLYYFQDGELTFKSPVVVGRYFGKEAENNRRTPQLNSFIEELVFNPSWKVPHSITVEEILPLTKKNPDYLTQRNMQLISSSGRRINPENVDFEKFNAYNFPYLIRQKPGKFNAMGQVKFLFPNPYGVYLHDTPQKKYFYKSERMFSHGCVRVQRALDLAYVLLAEEGLSEEEILELQTNPETVEYLLKDPVQVVLSYCTAYAIRHDLVFFYEDPYDYDEAMKKPMAPVLENIIQDSTNTYFKKIVENR